MQKRRYLAGSGARLYPPTNPEHGIDLDNLSPDDYRQQFYGETGHSGEQFVGLIYPFNQEDASIHRSIEKSKKEQLELERDDCETAYLTALYEHDWNYEIDEVKKKKGQYVQVLRKLQRHGSGMEH